MKQQHTCIHALHPAYELCTEFMQLFLTWARIQPYLMLVILLLFKRSLHKAYCHKQMPLETHTITLLQLCLQMLFTFTCKLLILTNLTLIIGLLKHDTTLLKLWKRNRAVKSQTEVDTERKTCFALIKLLKIVSILQTIIVHLSCWFTNFNSP